VINSVSYGDVQLDEYDTINCQGASIIEGFASEGLTGVWRLSSNENSATSGAANHSEAKW
jgi:hypothetical protein